MVALKMLKIRQVILTKILVSQLLTQLELVIPSLVGAKDPQMLVRVMSSKITRQVTLP